MIHPYAYRGKGYSYACKRSLQPHTHNAHMYTLT